MILNEENMKDMVIHDFSVLQTRIGEILQENRELLKRIERLESEAEQWERLTEETKKNL